MLQIGTFARLEPMTSHRFRPRPRWAVPFVALVTLAAAAVGSAAKGPAPPYRPPPIRPVISPRLPGEGVWRVAGTPIAGGPPLLVTTYRPDAGNPSVVAYVAWIDHTRTRLALYSGTGKPPFEFPRGLAEIPFSQRWRLLAAFNGGFEFGSHSGGGGGIAVGGHTYVWLQRGLGTVVGYRDGRVDVISWQGGQTVGRSIAFARQNLPLLVHDGRPGSDLTSQAVWGWTLGGGETVWRTGVGIDRRGNLIYAAADETTAGFAAILIRAGAVRAIELDINPEWPTFNVYAHRHGLLPAKFVPNPQQPATRYLSYPDLRDFFAVYRRLQVAPAPGSRR
jgi:Phosphodiester glycosidase